MKQILMNTNEVRAVLDSRKTQTRRVVSDRAMEWGMNWIWNPQENLIYALYQPGDILYVRETWNQWYELDANDQPIEGTGKYYYAADKEPHPFTDYVADNGEHRDYPLWRPSIHMPKEAARLFLKVTDVRVERLQEISEEDAEAEGFAGEFSRIKGPNGELLKEFTSRFCFAEHWDSTIKPKDRERYGWEADPWVWVIEFERCEKPEVV